MAEWESHYDDADFFANSSYGGYWDTDHWVAGGEEETFLMENGSWSTGYRPTQMRITFTGAASITIGVYLKNSSLNVSDTGYTSGEIKFINFTASDLSYIRIITGDAISITNIEWYIPPIEETLTEAAEAGDSIEYFSLSSAFSEAAGAGDSIEAQFEHYMTLTEAAGAGDAIQKFRESEFVLTEATGAGDSIGGFNWTTFLNQYEDLLITRFYFTLTGAEDGETDIELPISSFNCNLRSGDPTYLQVVVPGVDQSAVIAARPNGQLVIEMDYLLSGISQHQEEIVRVDLEDINIYEGGKNKSIVLLGHKTVTNIGKTVDLKYVSYQATVSGDQVIRAAIDMYLKPGDTAQYDGDTFIVGSISINVGEKTRTMEVQE